MLYCKWRFIMKKTLKLIILSSLIFLLTGCVQYQIVIDLSQEQTQLQSTLLIEKETLKSYDMTIASIKKQLLTNDDYFKNWTVTETEKKTDDLTYQGLLFQAPETLNQQLLDNLIISEQKGIVNYQFDLNIMKSGIDFSELENYKSTLSALKSNGASFELIIKMPGTVTASSLGTIEDDTVTIDLYEHLINGRIPEIKISATSQNVDRQFYAYFIFGVLIIIILITVHFITRKKPKKDI